MPIHFRSLQMHQEIAMSIPIRSTTLTHLSPNPVFQYRNGPSHLNEKTPRTEGLYRTDDEVYSSPSTPSTPSTTSSLFFGSKICTPRYTPQ